MNSIKEYTFEYGGSLPLDCGKSLDGFQLQYCTAGQLNDAGDNVIWVCHALTGSHEFHIWWEGLFGPDGPYSSGEYFIVCANMLGGCYGSTGPLSNNPATGKPYFHEFPQLSNKDCAKAFGLLCTNLGISSIHTLIGGSMGGQQALEWALLSPTLIRHLVLIATNARHSPWGIAFNESQRMAISVDPTWTQNHPDAGLSGMRAARATALLSYRNYDAYATTQDDGDSESLEAFRAASYQQYQGTKLTKRFNAFTYWVLSKAMDSHNVGRGRGGIVNALSAVQANTLIIGVKSDLLFPVQEQVFLANHIPNAMLMTIDTLYGHDGFLIETEHISNLIRKFYKPLSTNSKAI